MKACQESSQFCFTYLLIISVVDDSRHPGFALEQVHGERPTLLITRIRIFSSLVVNVLELESSFVLVVRHVLETVVDIFSTRVAKTISESFVIKLSEEWRLRNNYNLILTLGVVHK